MGDIREKMAEAMAEVAKDTASDLVRPTSKSIGDNIGLLVDGVMGWLGYWGEKQKIKRAVYLEDYKRRITESILGIPDANLIEPPIRIVGPAIEASKYFIEEEYCRDMFAKLIASACDSSKVNAVHPSFPRIVEQLTSLDARFLLLFNKRHTYPAAEITEVHKDGTVSPFPIIMFDFRENATSFQQPEEMKLVKTVENLSRFGIIIKNSAVIELSYDYDRFKSHWFYKAIAPTFKEGSTIRMNKYRIELTQLGEDFVGCCVPGK